MPEFLKAYFKVRSNGLFSTLNTPDALTKLELKQEKLILKKRFYIN